MTVKSVSMDSKERFEWPFEQRNLKPDFEQKIVDDGCGDADGQCLDDAVTSLVDHDAKEIQHHADIDAEVRRNQHEQEHRSEEAQDAAALLRGQEGFGPITSMMHEGHGEVECTRCDDDQADIEREIARLGTGIAPTGTKFE